MNNKGNEQQKERGTHAGGILTRKERARKQSPRLDTSVRPAQIYHRIRIILLLAVPPVPSIDLHIRLLRRPAVHFLHVLLE